MPDALAAMMILCAASRSRRADHGESVDSMQETQPHLLETYSEVPRQQTACYTATLRTVHPSFTHVHLSGRTMTAKVGPTDSRQSLLHWPYWPLALFAHGRNAVRTQHATSARSTLPPCCFWLLDAAAGSHLDCCVPALHLRWLCTTPSQRHASARELRRLAQPAPAAACRNPPRWLCSVVLVARQALRINEGLDGGCRWRPVACLPLEAQAARGMFSSLEKCADVMINAFR